MKKSVLCSLVILIAIAQALLLQSCGLGGKKLQRKYVLENGTNREITVQMYRNNSRYVTYARSGPGHIAEGMSNDGGGGQRRVSADDAFFNPDSAVVTIGDRRQVYRYIEQGGPPLIIPTVRNILVDSAYTVVSDNLYRFTFTEQDYQNAK